MDEEITLAVELRRNEAALVRCALNFLKQRLCSERNQCSDRAHLAAGHYVTEEIEELYERFEWPVEPSE